MKRGETECGKNVGAIDILQREKINRESIKKIGENETEKIFGWVKKCIENVSAKIKEQYKENYSY